MFLIKILLVALNAILSRVHGMDNKIPKTIESLAVSLVLIATLVFVNGYDVGYYLLLPLALIAVGKSMGHRDGLLMLRDEKISIKGIRAFSIKAIVMTFGLVGIAVFNDDVKQAYILSFGIFTLLLSYAIGYMASKIWDLQNRGTPIAELLVGGIYGFLCVI